MHKKQHHWPSTQYLLIISGKDLNYILHVRLSFHNLTFISNSLHFISDELLKLHVVLRFLEDHYLFPSSESTPSTKHRFMRVNLGMAKQVLSGNPKNDKNIEQIMKLIEQERCESIANFIFLGCRVHPWEKRCERAVYARVETRAGRQEKVWERNSVPARFENRAGLGESCARKVNKIRPFLSQKKAWNPAVVRQKQKQEDRNRTREWKGISRKRLRFIF